MKISIFIVILLYSVTIISAFPFLRDSNSNNSTSEPNDIQLYALISAKTRTLEISVSNTRVNEGDKILVTNSEPKYFTKLATPPDFEIIETINDIELKDNLNENLIQWTVDKGNILGVFEPKDWITTDIKFNYDESKNINPTTKCYSHWVSYIDSNGNILSMNCIRAYPTWQNDMRYVIGDFSMKQIFLPGSHDSGSYRPNFNPEKDETIVTKYSLTQDDDFRGQLMHGIRYLDIRMGYYRLTKEKFYIVHGIARQRPLREALEQLKEFVIQTNEIVIFDIRQLETGFDKIDTHRKLVNFILSYIGDYVVDASLTWDATLEKIWGTKKNIILTYGNGEIRREFPKTFFSIINHRWGNKEDWPSLENYLKNLHNRRSGSIPDSDMAELTPNFWGIITDKYGGLRNLADQVNSKVSELYLNELGNTTNILSVDFYRGTIVTELAIHFNKLRKMSLEKNIQK